MRGNLTSVAAAGAPIMVYPRVCGGTQCRSPVQGGRSGLSPRMRGNPVHLQVKYSRVGSIPAYAGEPNDVANGLNEFGVYPRVCGGTGEGGDAA